MILGLFAGEILWQTHMCMVQKQNGKRIKPSDTKTYYTQCRSIKNSENIFSEITDFDKVDVNLYGLIKAEYFAVDNNYVHFLDEKYLPKRKLIIMSATVDSELYKKIYP